MTTNIAIYLFPEVEALDFAGPYEVFTTAARVGNRDASGSEATFKVFSVAATLRPVRARAGLQIVPDFEFKQHPRIDVLIVPGGVITAELERSETLRWIRARATDASIVASVCTGAFILAKAGILTNQSVTTHWEDIADLAAMFPNLHVLGGKRWVDQGQVITSAGISAGIDMSLHLVERLSGRELAEKTARQMEFAWTENNR